MFVNYEGSRIYTKTKIRKKAEYVDVPVERKPDMCGAAILRKSGSVLPTDIKLLEDCVRVYGDFRRGDVLELNYW
jgi:hypothetical protein